MCMKCVRNPIGFYVKVIALTTKRSEKCGKTKAQKHRPGNGIQIRRHVKFTEQICHKIFQIWQNFSNRNVEKRIQMKYSCACACIETGLVKLISF